MPDIHSPAPFATERTDYQDQPFPYLVVDDLLPAQLFDQILKLWPDDQTFQDSIGTDSGRMPLLDQAALKRMSGADAVFWDAFVAGSVRYIIYEAMAWFGRPLFDGMKLGDGEMVVTSIDLLQLAKPFEGIPAHTHYHSPLLLGTCIIYVDDDEETSRGTNILELSSTADIEATVADLALGNTDIRHVDGMFNVAKHITFKQNRALILMDGPMCWHSANAAPLPSGPRRQIIINWALEESWMVRRHGVSMGQFIENRVLRPNSPATRSWVISDIHRQSAARRYSLDTSRKIFQSIPITIS